MTEKWWFWPTVATILCLIGFLAGRAQAQDLAPRTIDTVTTNLGCKLGQAGDGDEMCFAAGNVVMVCAAVPAGQDSVRVDVPIPASMTSTVRCLTKRHADSAQSALSANKIDVTSTLAVRDGPLLPPTVEE